MKKLSVAGLVMAALFCGPGIALGQWSIGGAVGSPDADIDVAVYDPPNTHVDDSSPVSWKVFAGYAFSENFGLEAGYTDLGDEYQLLNILGYGEFITLEPSAAYITLRGSASIHDRASLFARLGAAYWSVRVNYVENSFRSSERDGDVDPTFAIGFEFMLTTRFWLQFEWEEFQNVGDDASAGRPAGAGSRIELGGHDMRTVGVGLTYRFPHGQSRTY